MPTCLDESAVTATFSAWAKANKQWVATAATVSSSLSLRAQLGGIIGDQPLLPKDVNDAVAPPELCDRGIRVSYPGIGAKRTIKGTRIFEQPRWITKEYIMNKVFWVQRLFAASF